MSTHSNIICEDYSNGIERIPISVVNDVDDEDIVKIDYRTSRFSDIPNIRVLLENLPTCPGCSCEEDCSNPELCKCQSLDLWPDEFKEAILNFRDENEVKNFEKYYSGIYECNKNCKCSKKCSNRIVQHGLGLPLQIFKTKNSGWGVRTLEDIPKGKFITNYAGRILTSDYLQKIISILEVLKYEQKHIAQQNRYTLYLSEIASSKNPNIPPTHIFICDAMRSGNVSRFFNHSCDPNMVSEYVFLENLDLRLPEVAFFARRDIQSGEELTWDYNYEVQEDRLECNCGTENCRGKIFNC